MNKRYPMLSFRVSADEKQRAKNLAADLIRRFPYLNESDVYRELMGFTSTGLITSEMRARLRVEVEAEDEDSLPPVAPGKIDDVVYPALINAKK